MFLWDANVEHNTVTAAQLGKMMSTCNITQVFYCQSNVLVVLKCVSCLCMHGREKKQEMGGWGSTIYGKMNLAIDYLFLVKGQSWI